MFFHWKEKLKNDGFQNIMNNETELKSKHQQVTKAFIFEIN